MPSTRCMRCSLSGRFATSKLTNLLRPVNSELAGGQERSRQLCLSRYERAVLTDAVVLRALERSRSCASPQQQAVFEGAFPPAQPHTACILHTCRIPRSRRVLSSLNHHVPHVVFFHPFDCRLCGACMGCRRFDTAPSCYLCLTYYRRDLLETFAINHTGNLASKCCRTLLIRSPEEIKCPIGYHFNNSKKRQAASRRHSPLLYAVNLTCWTAGLETLDSARLWFAACRMFSVATTYASGYHAPSFNLTGPNNNHFV